MNSEDVKATPPLYEKYQTAIDDLVELFYKKVLADATLASFFTGVNMERQKRHMSAFIAYALGGPNHYSGRNMARAHQGLQITEGDFRQVSDHLDTAMEGIGVTYDDRMAILDTIYSLRDGIIGQ